MPRASLSLSLSSVVASRGSLAVRSGASTPASSTASSRLCTLISCAAALVASPGGRGPLLVVGLTAGSLRSRYKFCKSAVLVIAPSGICGSACWYGTALGRVESSICGVAGGFPLCALFWGFRFTHNFMMDMPLFCSIGVQSPVVMFSTYVTSLGIEDGPVTVTVTLAEHVVWR